MPVSAVGRRWTSFLVGAVLVTTALSSGSQAAAEEPAAPRAHGAPRAAEVEVADRFWSTPPSLLAAQPRATHTPNLQAPGLKAPTRGTVTGRLVDRAGRPLAGVLVSGVRFSDLRGVRDLEEDPAPQARTAADGRFRLPQLTERYLVRACDALEDGLQCAQDPAAKRFSPTYVGPDGVGDSWLTQTRMFSPRSGGRSLGTVVARPSAVLTGTFAGGAQRSVRLLRADGSTAANVLTDDTGRYRFEVAPGRYRTEVDRIEGLRSVGTVPGFRSRLLRLDARRATRLDFAFTPGATIYGRVTANGEPVAEQFIAITDRRGRFVAGVVTDEDGRYGLDALKPGRYTLSTPAAATAYVPITRTFTIATASPTRADLELRDGARIVLVPTDPTSADPDGSVIVELRDESGDITKAAGAAPGEALSFSGLPTGRYQVVLRRAADSSGAAEPDLPWAERVVDVFGPETADLGTVPVERPTLTISGTAPAYSRIRITPLPDVPYVRGDFTEGSGVTGLSVDWLTDVGPSGRFTIAGLVPGRYFVAVTAQYVDSTEGQPVYRGNVATTTSRLTVRATTTAADFSAPRGGTVTGRFRYTGNHRPVIAPFAFQVEDSGPRARLFPLLSKPQRYRGGFNVDRLHRGQPVGGVVDIRRVFDLADAQAEELPSNLTASASTEPGTPYWFTSSRTSFRTTPGRTTDVGWVDLKVRR